MNPVPVWLQEHLFGRLHAPVTCESVKEGKVGGGKWGKPDPRDDVPVSPTIPMIWPSGSGGVAEMEKVTVVHRPARR